MACSSGEPDQPPPRPVEGPDAVVEVEPSDAAELSVPSVEPEPTRDTPPPAAAVQLPEAQPIDVAYQASPDAEAGIARFLTEKMIRGWSHVRTPRYLVVHDDDVDRKVVARVVRELELLREQVFEPTFPPARTIEAVTIVRICESRSQYAAYGAPYGTAGYWSPYHEEVVLYQDRNDKKDALRVAYAVTCEAYLQQALGGAAGHDWFTMGHGDYYAGHRYKAGEFITVPFGWRTATAVDAKVRWKAGIHRFRRPAEADDGTPASPPSEGDERERLALTEWLTWSKAEYEGRNDFEWSRARDGNPRPVPGGVNAALGWSFIYFLRMSDDPVHARILSRYWQTLVALVQAAEPDEGAAATTDVPKRSEWRALALGAALEGVDVAQLEQDWLAHTWEE